MNTRQLLGTVLLIGAVAGILGGGWGLCRGLTRERPVPVVLVGGFGNKGDVWRERGYIGTMAQSPDLSYEGDIETVGAGPALAIASGSRPARVRHPVYTVSLTGHGFHPIPDSATELSRFIRFARDRHHARKVILVGFSLGGVVCREYITSANYQKDVVRLITISSPHLGSEFSWLYDVYRDRLAMSHDISNDALRTAATECVYQIDQAATRRGVRLTAPSLDMLHPPTRTNYLGLLNARPHPTDIDYTCIITAKTVGDTSVNDLFGDLKKIATGNTGQLVSASALADLSRQVCGLLAGNGKGLPGDGYVSAVSQDLRNVQFFREHASIPVKVVQVPVIHSEGGLQKELLLLILTAPQTPHP